MQTVMEVSGSKTRVHGVQVRVGFGAVEIGHVESLSLAHQCDAVCRGYVSFGAVECAGDVPRVESV